MVSKSALAGVKGTILPSNANCPYDQIAVLNIASSYKGSHGHLPGTVGDFMNEKYSDGFAVSKPMVIKKGEVSSEFLNCPLFFAGSDPDNDVFLRKE